MQRPRPHSSPEHLHARRGSGGLRPVGGLELGLGLELGFGVAADVALAGTHRTATHSWCWHSMERGDVYGCPALRSFCAVAANVKRGLKPPLWVLPVETRPQLPVLGRTEEGKGAEGLLASPLRAEGGRGQRAEAQLQPAALGCSQSRVF